MAADAPTPLCTVTQFNKGAFADLTQNLQPGELADVILEATRACESEVGRRLAPFTTTETHRAEGIDPDEYGDGFAGAPLDLPGTVGRSYASALGAGSLVRHMWLDNFAARYPELWTPYTVDSLTLIRSYGGTQDVIPSSMEGPEPDSGHVWFQLGTFLPVGSRIRVTYSGGYSTVPADLVRAAKAMTASIIIKELDPSLAAIHDPDLLRKEACEFLAPYGEGSYSNRSGGKSGRG